VIRHLYGVGEAEVMEWPAERWDRHRDFADLWMKRNDWTVSGG